MLAKPSRGPRNAPASMTASIWSVMGTVLKLNLNETELKAMKSAENRAV
ncbi:hypothetical protein PCURB6_20690 [Paenibacillus curdlanolyticus]|nr:hypothetical protein PCURB6_20690 [Paenibacillus curdlanolyticus]